MTVHRNKLLFGKTNRRISFQIYSGTQVYTFRAALLPIIRSYPLYIRHWHILYWFDDGLRVVSGCSILIVHARRRQTCIKCAECTVGNS
jgi:hypothetical protein